MTRITKQSSLSLYNKVAPLYGLLHHIQTLWADDIHRESVVTYANLNNWQPVERDKPVNVLEISFGKFNDEDIKRLEDDFGRANQD